MWTSTETLTATGAHHGAGGLDEIAEVEQGQERPGVTVGRLWRRWRGWRGAEAVAAAVELEAAGGVAEIEEGDLAEVAQGSEAAGDGDEGGVASALGGEEGVGGIGEGVGAAGAGGVRVEAGGAEGVGLVQALLKQFAEAIAIAGGVGHGGSIACRGRRGQRGRKGPLVVRQAHHERFYYWPVHLSTGSGRTGRANAARVGHGGGIACRGRRGQRRAQSEWDW